MRMIGASLQGDPSGWLKPPVDLGFWNGCIWLSATVATYCPTDKMGQTKLTGLFNQADG